MNRIFLTRAEYDRMLDHDDYDVNVYLKCETRWGINGVDVTGEESSIKLIEGWVA